MKTSDNKFWALKLVGIITVIGILQILFPQITDLFKLVSADIFSRPWILFTSIFLHGSIAHYLLNMFALALFGSILEQYIGTKKFLSIFFVSGICASIGASFLYPAALGASGAIFGVIGALAVAKPKMTVWILGIPAPMIVAAAVWAIQDIIGLFVPSNTANLAHLVGLVIGILMGLPFYQQVIKKKNVEVLSKSEVESWEKRYMRK